MFPRISNLRDALIFQRMMLMANLTVQHQEKLAAQIAIANALDLAVFDKALCFVLGDWFKEHQKVPESILNLNQLFYELDYFSGT